MKLKPTTYPSPISLFAIAALLPLMAFSIFAPFGELAPPAHADDTSTGTAGSTTGSNYYISITSNTSVAIAAAASTSGAITTKADNLTVSSNTNSGYKVYVSMDSSDTNGNRLYLNGEATDDTSKYLAPTSSTTLSTNSWGISTDTGDNKSYSAVPLVGNELLLKEYTTATPSVTLPIYFGVRANHSLVAGNYTGTIVYTALGNAPDQTTLSSTTTYTPGGETLTIYTPLLTSQENLPSATVTVGGTTCTDPEVTLGHDTGLYEVSCTLPSKTAGSYSVVVNYTGLQNNESVSYTASSNLTYIAPAISSVSPSTDLNPDGGESLTITTNISSSATITVSSITIGGTACTAPDVSTSGNYRTLTCTTPKKDAGTYAVAATISFGGTSTTMNYSGTVGYASSTDPSLFYAVTTMQSMTADICNQVETPSADATSSVTTLSAYNALADKTSTVPQLTLTDSRDSQKYTVRKLADGNCWMTENLRYGSTTSNAQRAYTSTDAAKSDNVNTTNMAKLTTTYISTASNCGSYFTSSYYTQPSVCIYDANTTDNVSGTGTKFGALYNYCAATGGTVCTPDAMTEDAGGSICPKNWKLPTMDAEVATSGTSTYSYNNLTVAYGLQYSNGFKISTFSKLTSAPLSFPRAGYAYNGSLDTRSSTGRGYYSASTKYTSTDGSYNLYFSSNAKLTLLHRSGLTRDFGLSVRCVVPAN